MTMTPASRKRSTPMKMERIESSETSALKAETPGDYPKNKTAFNTRRKFEIKIDNPTFR